MNFKTSISSRLIRTAIQLLLGIILLGNSLYAAVTVTAATGGTNISADKAANAASPLYTTLGNIVITEGAKGDFATGTGITLILTAPSGWQFNTPGSVTTSVTAGGNITVTNVAVAASTITITMTVGGTNKTDVLTIIGAQVQPTDGANLPASGNILRTIANPGTATIAGITNGTTNFGSLSQAIGAMSRLVVTLPGQTFTDAATLAGSGNSGTATAQTAGTSFNISALRATDQFYNVVTTYTGAKTIAYSGPGGSASTYTTSVTFASGVSSTALATNLKRAETTTITATDGGLYGFASSSLTVNTAAFSKMQLIVPGETTDAGSSTGKTGAPSTQTAGTGFTVTVNAVDAYWNLVSGAPGNTISITTADPNDIHPLNAALVSGTKNFTVTFNTAGSSTVTATNASDGTKTADTSPSITINAGSFAKLQILAPGESAAPGTVTGKTGSPSARTAGSSFNVTVNAVDANWNVVSSVSDNAGITSSDANATLPSNNALSSGTQTFSVTLRTAGTATVTASDITDPLKSANTTPSLTVNAGSFTKLQILVPGETASPGSATGKTGTPDVQTAAILFTVTVNAVDADWNLVNTVTDVVGLTSTDGSATLSGNSALSSGTGTRNVIFSTNGSFTVTATDITNGSKTADTSPSITTNPAGTGTLTPATGGSTISADSVGGLYTSLAGPVYEEGQEGNISAGTIILNAPSGFIFDTGSSPTLLITRTAGSGADSRNINSVASGTSIAATSVTTTQMTFTITNASNNLVTNSITWQNVRVRPTAGYPLASGNLTKTGTATIAGVTNGSTNFGTLTEVAGDVNRLVVTFPGQTFNEGSGNSGSVTNQTAGSSFDISSLTAADQYFNTVSSYSGVKTIAYSGPAGTASTYTTSVNFTSGVSTTSLATTLTRAEATTITATESGQYGLASSTLTVTAGVFTKMQLIVPGETVSAGSVSGKTGTPSARTAGTAFSVTVNAVDANWNIVAGAPNNSITLTTSDANAVMPSPANLSSGTVTFATVTLPTAGTATVTATNSSDGTKTADTSPSITVNPGSITKLQILVPGETAAPGTATGKTGTPANQASGSPFTATVNSVDANWNLVSSTDVIQITSSDGAATLPSNAALIGGTNDFTVALNTAGTQTVTATDVTNGSITANTTPSITVAAVVITPASGGSAIAADDFGTGAWTSLTGPSYDEAASGDVGTGTIILNVPSGFIFDVGGVAPTVLMTRLTGGGNQSRNINGLVSGTSIAVTSISTTQITFTVTSASNSGNTCQLTWQNIRVRPTAGTPLASGNLTKTGTSTMTGVTNTITNFGTITETFGAINKLIVTLPGETFTAGSGNSGTPSDQIENISFNISSITAADQYFNIVTSYTPAGSISYSGPAGSPSYTTAVSFSNGVSTTTLATTLTAIENTTITANDGSISGPASTAFNVNGAPKTWDGGASTNNWGDANNWNPNGVPTSANDVTLSGANTININTAANTKNLAISNAGLLLTIQSGNSLTVNGNYTQSSGTVNTEAAFPAVSGTVSMSGGTFGFSNAGVQNVSAQTYNNLTISGSGTKTALGVLTITGDLTINSGTLDDNGYQIVGNVGGAVSMAGGSNLLLGSAATATAFPSNFVSGNISLNSASTVIYNSDQPQNIDVVNFGSLSSGGTGNRTFPASQTVGVSGTFTPGSNSYTITSSTIDFNGTSAQTIPAFNYNNLTSSSTGARTLASSGTIGIAGTFVPGSNSYTITSSIVDFNGSGAQTIAAFNYNDLTISSNRGGAAVTLAGGTIAVAGSCSFTASNVTISTSGNTFDYNGTTAQSVAGISYGTLTFSNAGVKTINSTVSVNNDMIVNSTADVTVGVTGILTVTGDLINDGILTNDGSITLP